MRIKYVRKCDAEMIQMIQSQNRAGAVALYDGYSAVILLAIIRINPQKEIAEDILEDTFIKIWNTIGLYSIDQGSLLSWMMAIARNAAEARSKLTIISKIATTKTQKTSDQSILSLKTT